MHRLASILVPPFVLLLACSSEVDARLLDVTELSTARLEATGRLGIEGEGFPAGRTGRVVFEGVIHRPARGEHPVRVEAPVQAVARERIELRGSRELVERFGGRGTFEGRVHVLFDAAGGEGVVSGVLDRVTFDVIDGTSFTGDDAIAMTRSARTFLDELGVEEARDATGQGIVIDGVVPGGLAARADMQKGDRIVALGGLHIDTISDLAPPPNAAYLDLTIARPGRSESLVVRVATDREPTVLRGALFAPLAVLALLLAILLTLTPLAHRVHRLGVALGSGARSAHRYILSNEGERRGRLPLGVRIKRVAWSIVAALSAVTALGVLPFSAHRVHGGVGVGLLALGVLGAFAMAELSPDASARPRVVARHIVLARLLSLVVPLAAAVAVAAIASGSMRLAGIVAAQGGEPWRWAVFTSPAGLLAFPALVATSIAEDGGAQGGSPWATRDVANRVRLFLSSGLGAALFLGGWKLPFVEVDPLDGVGALRLLGALVFVAKAWLLMVVTVHARPSLEDLGRSARSAGVLAFWPIAFALVAAAVGIASLLEPPPKELAETLGPITLFAVVIVAARALHAARRPRAPLTGVAPFL